MVNTYTIKYILLGIVCLSLTQAVLAGLEADLPSKGKYIRLQTASKQLFTIYVAGPEEAKRGLLLIHGWWGLNKDVEHWADQFAAEGYRVMAIDLYNRNVTTNPAIARKLMSAVNQTEANEKYATAIKVLSAPERKIAVIGRSYGASQAFHAACVAQERVSAVVVYYPYGELMTDKAMLSAIKTPILGHFARDDFFLTPDKLALFTSAIEKKGIKMTVNMYEAKHGFDNQSGKNFNASAKGLAQARTRQFLNKYLN